MHGKTYWVIPEGFIPAPGPHGDDPKLRSHEAACVLNPNEEPAQLSVTIYFADREPLGPFHLEVKPRRTLHFRFGELKDPAPIPHETDYSSVIEASRPVIVQHTRMDARLGGLALLSTIAYGED